MKTDVTFSYVLDVPDDVNVANFYINTVPTKTDVTWSFFKISSSNKVYYTQKRSVFTKMQTSKIR